MEELIKHLKELMKRGLIHSYALGGATALIYYFEPVQTQDVDVFICLSDNVSPLINLSPIYSYFVEHGIQSDQEYLLISGIPVQLLVPYNPLVQEAVESAIEVGYHALTVRIPPLEYLMAIMVQTGRPKDKARLYDISQFPELFSLLEFERIIAKFGLTEKWRALKEWFEK